MYVCMFVCSFVCTYVSLYLYVWICLSTYVYIYMHKVFHDSWSTDWWKIYRVYLNLANSTKGQRTNLILFFLFDRFLHVESPFS